MYTSDVLDPWPRSPQCIVLDRISYRHMEQPPRAWILAGSHAWENRHTEVRAGMLAEARTVMLAEACAQKFLLILQVFLLKVLA